MLNGIFVFLWQIPMEQLLISNIMSAEVLTAPADSLLKDALTKMSETSMSCVVAVKDGHPIGIFSESDAVRLLTHSLSDGSTRNVYLGEVMTKKLVTIEENSLINDAFNLKRQYKIRHIPVVNSEGLLVGIITQTDLLMAHSQIVENQRCFMAKAVADQTKELQEMNAQLQLSSARDAMLDIGNRIAMERDLSQTHATALRYDRPYSVALIDVDFFKSYSERYGHTEAGNALQRITINISKAIRQPDQLYRFGGNRLLLLMPETEIEGAQIITSRIVEDVEDLDIPHEDTDFNVLTVSAGIADNFSGGICSAEWRDVVERAEKGLNVAIRNGRNQIAVHEASFAEEVSANLKRSEDFGDYPQH